MRKVAVLSAKSWGVVKSLFALIAKGDDIAKTQHRMIFLLVLIFPILGVPNRGAQTLPPLHFFQLPIKYLISFQDMNERRIKEYNDNGKMKQRRNKHEISTQIQETQSQTAKETRNRCGGLHVQFIRKIMGTNN